MQLVWSVDNSSFAAGLAPRGKEEVINATT